jgi:hypothetical protein
MHVNDNAEGELLKWPRKAGRAGPKARDITKAGGEQAKRKKRVESCHEGMIPRTIRRPSIPIKGRLQEKPQVMYPEHER